MGRNTPKLWDELWDRPVPEDRDIRVLEEWEKSVRWRRLASIIAVEFATVQNLRVIEIGAGSGALSALLARRGAKVTLLDYSDSALSRAREFYRRNGLEATFLRQDALGVPPELFGAFDVCISVGLSEHFRGEERLRINKVHFDLVRSGGLVFNSVPNRFCPPYRIYKLLAELTGHWRVGEEIPYSRAEFRRICSALGIRDFTLLGESVLGSFQLINPVRIFRRLTRQRDPVRSKPIPFQKATPLDAYIGYALVLCAKKE